MDPAQPQLHSDETVVVVPCFNEARRLPVAAYDAFLQSSASVTLIFVDDGSTDDTPLVVERLRQQHPRRVCTLRLHSNVGKAEAVRRGMRAALRRQSAFVGYWDADLATPLNAIGRFADVLRSRPELELVMGSRVSLLGRNIRRSTVRHFTGRVFATAASLVLRLPVYDTQCGAKLFRATESLRAIIGQPFEARWIFDVEILARMMRQSREDVGRTGPLQIYEYPLDDWCDVGGSTLKASDFLIAGIDLAAIYWRYRAKAAERLTTHVPSARTDVFAPRTRAA
jgi:glycosyltransferase involved in cell wall biosynthesis